MIQFSGDRAVVMGIGPDGNGQYQYQDGTPFTGDSSTLTAMPVAPAVSASGWWRVGLSSMENGVRSLTVTETAGSRPVHQTLVSWWTGAHMQRSGTPLMVLQAATREAAIEKARRIIAVIEDVSF